MEKLSRKEINEPSEELVEKIRIFYEKYKDISKTPEYILREIIFFKRILNSLDIAKQENLDKEVIVLFDIDETLAKAKLIENGFEHILRPSAIELLSKIKTKGMKIGFITSRGKLESQLNNELKELKDFIDKEYMFSVRDLNVCPPGEESIEKSLPEELKYSLVSGDFTKMKLLNELISNQQNKNKVFIPIDDFKYPILYKYGIALEDNQKFFI